MMKILVILLIGIAMSSTLIGVAALAIAATETLIEEIRECRKIHRKEE